MNGNDLVTLGATLWTRQCRGERIDALEKLPYFRLLFIRQRRAGAERKFTEYGHLLKLAMRPTLHYIAQRESDLKVVESYREVLRAAA